MDAKFDELLKTNIITKCKVSLACSYQEGSHEQPTVLNKYELAYIIHMLRGDP